MKCLEYGASVLPDVFPCTKIGVTLGEEMALVLRRRMASSRTYIRKGITDWGGHMLNTRQMGWLNHTFGNRDIERPGQATMPAALP